MTETYRPNDNNGPNMYGSPRQPTYDNNGPNLYGSSRQPTYDNYPPQPSYSPTQRQTQFQQPNNSSNNNPPDFQRFYGPVSLHLKNCFFFSLHASINPIIDIFKKKDRRNFQLKTYQISQYKKNRMTWNMTTQVSCTYIN
jgi:hypothetical protein